MSKGKAANHSMKSKAESKNVSQYFDYLNTKTLQMHPGSDEYINRLAIELVTWAEERKDAFYIEQFCNLKNILEKTYYEWVKKYPVMQNAHQAAMQHLASRNELILRKEDPTSLRYIMPQLSPRWLREDERRAEQKIKLAAKQNEPFTSPNPEDLNWK